MQPERGIADSTQELLAIVDHADQVIGAASRADIHRRRLRHRSVHILVSNPYGEIYVQRRAEHKDCAPGLWDTSAAGHVDFGESYQHAAVRELAEELAITDAVPAPWWTLPADAQTGNEFVHVFRCVTRSEPCPDAYEIAAGEWSSVARLEAWVARSPATFTAVFRAIFARHCAQLGGAG